MRVFLDIGAHVGETVEEVLKPNYDFQRIVCFEPASQCVAELRKFKDKRVEICPFGLAGRNGTAKLYGAGSLGGSTIGGEGAEETIELVDVAEWFRANLDPSDDVVVKTNCEGGEVEIIEKLLETGLMAQPVSFLITLDIRDFPEHRHKEIELRQKLEASGLRNFCFSDDVMIGPTHGQRIAHWLGLFGLDKPGWSKAAVNSAYGDQFRRFAAKSGRRQRIEMLAKEKLGYGALPEPIKNVLRALKRAAGLSREG